MLTEMQANPDLVNSAGLTAFQLMLSEANETPRYAGRTAASLFRRLMPASIAVMVRARLVKLDSHQAEFLFYNLFVALFHTRGADNAAVRKLGLRAADLEEALKNLPPSAVPAYRTRRAYISGVLARNEVDRDERSNRRLFKRTSRGFYVLNPGLQVRIGDAWVAIYDLVERETLFREVSPNLPRDLVPIVERSLGAYRNWAMAVFAGEKPGPPPN